jgi:hypothetical protein
MKRRYESYAKRALPALPRERHHRAVVQAEIEDRLHHAGHRYRRARPDGDEQGVRRVPEPASRRLFEPTDVGRDLIAKRVGERAALQIFDADGARDGEPGGTGTPRFVISARFAPLPPSTWRISRVPSALPLPKK